MATQGGRVTLEQAQSYHPQAVQELGLWDKLQNWQTSDLQEYGAQEKIKAHLDTVWTDMGLKANEKSPAYIEALHNAKADYATKFNRYVAMGYSKEDASYYALRGKAGEVKDKQGQSMPGEVGVLTEIEAQGPQNKYTVAGQSVERSLKPGHIRVARINSGKKEILNDRSIVTKGTIGGAYGHKQISTIKNNLEKFGQAGLYMDKGALQYYEGLARGRNPKKVVLGV